jgi:hypothetical protein
MKEGPREIQLREMREARARHPNPFEDVARGRDPVAKATKAKPPKSDDVSAADRVASRLGAGRTAQDTPRLETAGAVAIQKRGRPRKPDSELSRASKYRRQKEQRK